MDRAYASGAAGSAPSAPASPSTGYPTAGNPGSGTPATKPGPYWYHMITEELRALIVAAGLTPDYTAIDQVLRAVRTIAPAVVGTFRNLAGSAPGAAKTASWTASELVAKSALGGISYVGASLSLSFNGATTGANGMDTGATPTSGSLYIYAIYNPTTATWATLGTTAGSGAAVYGGANMPAGYTASALIWSGVTNGSGQIGAMVQQDREVQIAQASALSGGASASYASVSVSTIVPANAKTIGGAFGATGANMYLASTSAGIGQIWTSASTYGAVAAFRGLQLTTAQTMCYYVASGSGGQATISSYTI